MSGPASTNVSHGSVLMAVGAHFSDRGKEDKSKGTKARAVRANASKATANLNNKTSEARAKVTEVPSWSSKDIVRLVASEAIHELTVLTNKSVR